MPMTPRERQGWMMVPVLFVILAIIVGCIDSMGVLFTPLIKHFGWSRTDYDVERLRELLTEAGLPADRLAKVIIETVSYKVNAAVAKQLEASNINYAVALAASRTVTAAPWRVTIKQPC